VKNKVGKPFGETHVSVLPGHTLAPASTDGDTIRYASNKGLFDMSGSWYWMDLGNVDEKKKPIGKEQLANGLAALKTG